MDSQMTEDNGGNFFVAIAAKWLVSGTDDHYDHTYTIKKTNARSSIGTIAHWRRWSI